MRRLWHRRVRVLILEDEPYMAEAIRDGLRLEAIAADIAADGDAALELMSVNAYDIAVLDRTSPDLPVTTASRARAPASPDRRSFRP
jgi:DNA-binding response OmpR family regulator